MLGQRDDRPYPAMVTRIDDTRGSVSLTIWSEGRASAMMCQPGIRHIDDPDHNDNSRKENGAWEMSPELKLLHTLAKNYG